MSQAQFKVDKISPSFWEVTFLNPPINLIDANTIVELNELLADAEVDSRLNKHSQGSADTSW